MVFKNLAVIILLVAFGYLGALYLVLLIMLVIDMLPTLVVHIQYLLINNGKSLIINTTKRTFSLNTREKAEQHFDDIISLERYLSFVRPTGWHSFGEYRCYKIVFTDRTEFIITWVRGIGKLH